MNFAIARILNKEKGGRMYLRILKNDLRRKRTMNAIMLIFIIIASAFIASSANNLVTVATALDEYFEMAEVPDYWFVTPHAEEGRRFKAFAEENGFGLNMTTLVQIDPRDITIDGNKFENSSSVVLSPVEGTKIFDKNENRITHVNDGEIYITSEIFNSGKNAIHEGCKITINSYGITKEFTLKGYTKDALFGSSMSGMTRFLISENDFKLFYGEGRTIFTALAVYTDDGSFMEKFNEFNLKSTMNVNRSGIKMMYIMDTLIAAVILVVSICLILISMVILRFTINFTMSEEFREIGVMKAIGIPDFKIRALYIVKYLAVSVAGAAVGLFLSFPFGKLLLESVSKNIIISGADRFYLNIICAFTTAAVVVLFCFLCTGKIRHFSPIDAIRNGETGERYARKSLISLSRSVLKPIPFMAVNDIFCSLKKYISMIIIFTLGILLIIIPVNTINTLQSDKLITLFNMADCDIAISQELLFSSNGRNREMINQNLDNVRKFLRENNIDADVFQEIMFRFNISHNGKKSSSLAFQGTGGITTDMYSYIEGTPPQNKNEIAISYIIADKIDAGIGDEVEIDFGDRIKKYTVTAINQTMNNLGEGIRFYQEEDIDYNFAAGSFGIQISYKDSPDKSAIKERKQLLKKKFSDTDVYSAGEYISFMIGDVAGQLENVKSLILTIIICINILVSVLMIKSFITKEKGEIAMLKAIGFSNSSLVAWQSMRIGLVLLISIIIGTTVSAPLSKLTIEPVFRMMGAYSIQFDIVPIEVYVLYPLAVLISTVLASAIGSLQLRKISAAETSDIE